MYLPVATSHSAEPIRFGAIFAKTGAASEYNAEIWNSLRLAVEEINKNGGLLDRPLEILEIDNHSTAIGARLAAREAVAAGVCAVIGASWSSHSIAMASVLQKAGITMITPSSTHPQITLEGNFIFRLCATDTFQGSIIADFVIDSLKPKSIVILTNTGQRYCLELARSFISRLKKRALNQFQEIDYLQDISDTSLIIGKIRELQPEVVFLPSYHNDSAIWIKKAREAGISSIFVGGDGWRGDSMPLIAGDGIDGCYFCDHWNRYDPSPGSRAYISAYEPRFGRIFGSSGALTYDAVHLLSDAVRRAGSTDSAKIALALARTTDFVGVTGKICFDENGDPKKPMFILKFEKEHTALVKRIGSTCE